MTTLKEDPDEGDRGPEKVAYALMREVKDGLSTTTVYDWFTDSIDKCTQRMEAKDYDASDCLIYSLPERTLDKFLARSLAMREYAKKTIPEKIAACNLLLVTMSVFPFDHMVWELQDTPGFFGWKLKGGTVDTNRLNWTER